MLKEKKLQSDIDLKSAIILFLNLGNLWAIQLKKLVEPILSSQNIVFFKWIIVPSWITEFINMTTQHYFSN